MNMEGIKTELELESEDMNTNPTMAADKAIRHSAFNIMEDYFSVKEEPVIPAEGPKSILCKIDAAMVYTTKIDDMPFLMQSKNVEKLSYNVCITKIERMSKPDYVPGTVVKRKRKLSHETYNEMRKRLKVILKKREIVLLKHKRLLNLCKPVSVMLENIPAVKLEIKGEYHDKDVVEIKTEDVNNIVEIADSDEDAPIANIITSPNPQQYLQNPRSTLTRKQIDYLLEPNWDKIHFILYKDRYFNNSVVCAVDNRGKLRTYLAYTGLNNAHFDKILQFSDTASVKFFTRCCWYQFNIHIQNIFSNLFRTRTDLFFLYRPHKCRHYTCECCCKNQRVHPHNKSVEILTYKSELIALDTHTILNLRQLVSSEIRSYLYRINIPKNICKTGIVNAKTKFIHFKNIETYQSELYYLNYNKSIGGYYVTWYKYKISTISTIFNFALVRDFFIICCWARRESAISGLLLNPNFQDISSSIIKYMKRIHACEPQRCKCCCKNKIKEKTKNVQITFKPLDLPSIKKHTVFNRPLKNIIRQINLLPNLTGKQTYNIPCTKSTESFSVAKKTLVEKKENQSKLNENKTNLPTTMPLQIPVLVTPIAPMIHSSPVLQTNDSFTSNKPQLSQTLLVTPLRQDANGKFMAIIPKPISSTIDPVQPKQKEGKVQRVTNPVPNTRSLSKTIITVDHNRKVAAVLPAPVTTYSTEELQELAKFLTKAQEQIDTLLLPPGSKINITQQSTNNYNLTPMIPENIKKTQKHKIYKLFTDTAIEKSQYYKKCFYFGNNMEILKINESDSGIKNVPTDQRYELLKKIGFNLPGPSRVHVPVVLPSTSQISPNPNEELAQLTPIIDKHLVAASGEILSDEEYDIQYSDMKEEFDDGNVTLEENNLFQIESDSESNECILGN